MIEQLFLSLIPVTIVMGILLALAYLICMLIRKRADQNLIQSLLSICRLSVSAFIASAVGLLLIITFFVPYNIITYFIPLTVFFGAADILLYRHIEKWKGLSEISKLLIYSALYFLAGFFLGYFRFLASLQ